MPHVSYLAPVCSITVFTAFIRVNMAVVIIVVAMGLA
jgi:hypothetical protein